MNSFGFLLSTPAFASFADVVAAESTYAIDPATCVMKDCRL